MAKKPTKKCSPLNLRKMSKNTKAGFKAWCAARNYTMEEAAEGLFKKAIMENISIKKYVKRK